MTIINTILCLIAVIFFAIAIFPGPWRFNLVAAGAFFLAVDALFTTVGV